MARGSLRIILVRPRCRQDVRHAERGSSARGAGTDVVIGLVETHVCPRTAEQVGDLEVIPRRKIEYRGTTLEEMDLDAVLARHPKVGLSTSSPTRTCRAPQPQAVGRHRALLEAGIDVISTVNIEHLECLNDVVEGSPASSRRKPSPTSSSAAPTRSSSSTDSRGPSSAHWILHRPDRRRPERGPGPRTGRAGPQRVAGRSWPTRDAQGPRGRHDRGRHRAWPARSRVTPGRCRLAALVGPTGVGKTTTIAKLAANFRLKEKRRVGLITVDTYRIAAVEQLRTYADIIDLPMQVVSTPREMREAVARMADLDLILMDTAGRSPKDEVSIQELKAFLGRGPAPTRCTWCSAAWPAASALEQTAERFAAVGTTALILTKLDEADGLGNVLPLLRSQRAAAELPDQRPERARRHRDGRSAAAGAGGVGHGRGNKAMNSER